MKPLSLMPLLILIIQTLLFTTACKQSTEPKLEAVLKLELEDASCTEAWIKFSSTNIQIPNSVILIQDGVVRKTINVETQDTLLYIDSLLPNKTYKFQTFIQSSNQQINTSSNELTVTTMDTTSHEFTWQSWEFGTIGSSSLYDVAIINENDIWAVGEINIADTSINGYTTYNAVHWDGTKWELKRILYKGGIWVIKTIFAFSSNDIWFSGYVRYLNGQFIELTIPDILIGWSINKLWGSSSEDLYAVGNNGNIAHWDGRKWTKIESGTTVDLKSVSGNNNDLFISGNSLDQSESLLLRLTNFQARTVWYNNNINGTDPYGNIIYCSKVTDNNLFLSSNRGIYRETIG
ncbi:MAG: glucosyl transferase, partial [Ignavibacterium sp.]|uniref:glucosyl transferase n=1 Tax=Ignavibacterium sp. TaxID=2651167 RepID=UPI00329A4500